MNNLQFVSNQQFKDDFKSDCGGTLFFPTKYRAVKICDIDSATYQKFRRKHKITGKIRIFIETQPDNWNENKHIKYKYPHCVDKDELFVAWGKDLYNLWMISDSCYIEYGNVFGYHPFGKLYVVRESEKICKQCGKWVNLKKYTLDDNICDDEMIKNLKKE